MNLTHSRKDPFQKLAQLKPSQGAVVLAIILSAMAAFEMFNYGTTEHALHDLLGDLTFAGFRWATMLTIAFCAIDFAGIARIFTPAQLTEEPREVWYLFGAWLLAATMNAFLTWWGISLAISNHVITSTSVLSASTVTGIIPAFVAVLVWIIRILIIGSLSMTGDRLIWHRGRQPAGMRNPASPLSPGGAPSPMGARPLGVVKQPMAARPMKRPASPVGLTPIRPEPTYHGFSRTGSPMQGRDNRSQQVL